MEVSSPFFAGSVVTGDTRAICRDTRQGGPSSGGARQLGEGGGDGVGGLGTVGEPGARPGLGVEGAVEPAADGEATHRAGGDDEARVRGQGAGGGGGERRAGGELVADGGGGDVAVHVDAAPAGLGEEGERP